MAEMEPVASQAVVGRWRGWPAWTPPPPGGDSALTLTAAR